MPQFDLKTDAWVEVVPAGGSVAQMIVVSIGEALVSLGAPDALTKAIKVGASVGRSMSRGRMLTAPAGVAVFVRPSGPRVVFNVGAAESGDTSSPLRQLMTRRLAAADATAPDNLPEATGATFTLSATNTSPATSNNSAISNPERFLFSGGRPMPHRSLNNRLYFVSADYAPQTTGIPVGTDPNTLGSWSWTAAVQTRSPIVVFQLYGVTSRAIRVLVNGRYISKTQTLLIVNNNINYVIVDLTGFQSDADPIITIESDSIVGLYGVLVQPGFTVAKPAVTERFVMLIAGDSYTEGFVAAPEPTFFNNRTMAATLARLIGVTDKRQCGIGGTGYIHPGSSPPKTGLRGQIPAWLGTANTDLTAADVNLIVLASGYNDRGTYTGSQVGAEAALTVQAVRAAFPNAVIMVLGPWGGATGPNASIIDIENGIISAVNALALPNVFTVPVSTASPPWLNGTGYQGATNGSGNTDTMISRDGSHPSLIGYEYLAGKVVEAYRQIVTRVQ